MVQKTVSRVRKTAAKAAAKTAANAPAGPTPAAPNADAAKRKRGRPRAYDPELALSAAMDVFWKEGYAATSLDELSAATGMNRPSLYGAFGDKRDIYIKAYETYRARTRAEMAGVFGAGLSIRPLLQRVFAIAIEMYLSGKDGPRGCFTVMTATSEAISDPEIRDMVVSGLRDMDRAFAGAFKAAQATGEIPASADPDALASLMTATIHTIAVRARAQVPRKQLEAIARGAIDLVCGAGT